MKISAIPRTRDEHGRTRFRSVAIMAGAFALALGGALVGMGPANAADGPFNIDGNVPDAGATLLTDPSGNVKELGPKNSNSTKIGVIHTAEEPMLALTNPNGQVDLRNAWLTTAKGTETTPHDWLYFAWQRDANSGSGFIAYEFMQNAAPTECAYDTALTADLIAGCNPWANRSADDFMILWDQSGSGTELWLRTWSEVGGNLVLSAPVGLNAAVSQAQFSADGFRGEAAVDLTATIFSGVTDCRVYANTIPSTVTGNSDQADYKDTILKQTPPISNCGGVTITKKDDDSPASNLAGAVFTLYRDAHPADTETGPIGEDTVTTYTCTTAATTGTCTIAGVAIGDYWVVETTTPAGHATAPPQKLQVTAGSSATLTFTDPRQFTVITIVCRNSDNSLYPSSVTLTGGAAGETTPKTSLGTAPSFATAAQLCGLGGATFSPRQFGAYTGSVTIPQ
jgi:hypothetical protein